MLAAANLQISQCRLRRRTALQDDERTPLENLTKRTGLSSMDSCVYCWFARLAGILMRLLVLQGSRIPALSNPVDSLKHRGDEIVLKGKTIKNKNNNPKKMHLEFYSE